MVSSHIWQLSKVENISSNDVNWKYNLSFRLVSMFSRSGQIVKFKHENNIVFDAITLVLCLAK